MSSTNLRPHLSYREPAAHAERVEWLPRITRPFGRGVRHKLVLVSLAILIAVSFGFLLLHGVISSGWIDEDLRDRAVTFGQEISATIEDQEEFGNGPALESNIRRMMAVRSNVLQIDILKFTPEGTVVVASSHMPRRLPFSRADSRRARQGKPVSKLADVGGTRAWDTLVPVSFKGDIVGAVGTRFSLEHADRLHFRINLWALVFTGISVIVMGYLMVVAVTYVVNRPVSGLLSAIQQVHDSGTTSHVRVTSGDEFEILANHFNDMMVRINNFNKELDQRIKAATRELDQKYQEVQRLNTMLYITQRKLSQAERLAVAGRVVAQVAHEVGTPLHSIAGHLELLRAELPAEVTGAAARRLGIVENQVARVSGVIRQLLDVVRRDRPVYVAVDIAGLAQDCAAFVSPGMSAAALSLRLQLDPDLPPVNGDRDQLMQVVLNLLSNALDATPAGGTVTVRARLRSDKRQIEIAVEDTGIGIAQARQKEIFEPFVSSKPPGQGTGLGLYIAAQIVREHGGRIEVQSVEDQGSTMTVILPIAGEQQ
jgi:two-component system, NtrC family, sensor kinase